MNLIELIPHLKTLEKADRFISKTLPDVEFGQVDIYLKEKLDTNSEIKVVDAETMDGKTKVEIDGVVYVNLFPLVMLQEMVEGGASLPGKRLSDLDIANKVMEYRINDA